MVLKHVPAYVKSPWAAQVNGRRGASWEQGKRNKGGDEGSTKGACSAKEPQHRILGGRIQKSAADVQVSSADIQTSTSWCTCENFRALSNSSKVVCIVTNRWHVATLQRGLQTERRRWRSCARRRSCAASRRRFATRAAGSWPNPGPVCVVSSSRPALLLRRLIDVAVHCTNTALRRITSCPSGAARENDDVCMACMGVVHRARSIDIR